MSMTDPIADFLTRVRNAIHAAHETVEIPDSKLKGSWHGSSPSRDISIRGR